MATSDLVAYTPKQAAAVSQLGMAAIESAIAAGDLKVVPKPPANRYRLVLHEDLIAYMRSLQS